MKRELRTVQVTRYVTPLREGGSLPAIAEADDGFLYVLKFRGAGQGTRALIADLVGGELARAAGFNVPELVFAWLDESFGQTEPDEEIQDLLRASEGLNLGLHYLSGAISYDPAANHVDAAVAARILWLDALLMNVDRTARNTNMLTWYRDLWLIDHGASMYFHHSGTDWQEASLKPFTQIKDHVFLRQGLPGIDRANEEMTSLLAPETINAIARLIPDSWLSGDHSQPSGFRDMYRDFLANRVRNSAIFVNEIKNAGKAII